MELHKFWGRNRRAALSSEFSGNNLPEASGPWLYERSIDMPEHDPAPTAGSATDEIIAAVERDGYYLLDDDDPDGNGARLG
jgi:hypothetical protein